MKRMFIILLTLVTMSSTVYSSTGKNESITCENPVSSGCEVQIGDGRTFILTWKQFVRYMTKTNEVTLYGLGYRVDGRVEIYFTFN